MIKTEPAKFDPAKFDADMIDAYIQHGRQLRSEAMTKMVVAAGRAISGGVKFIYHFATDWMVDLYQHRAH